MARLCDKCGAFNENVHKSCKKCGAILDAPIAQKSEGYDYDPDDGRDVIEDDEWNGD